MMPNNLTATYTDLYQITMGQVYFLEGHANTPSVFDYFFRKLPFQGGYAVFAGLHDVLEVLEGLHFSQDDIDFLKTLNLHSDYLKYLKDFQFKGNVYSCMEGDLVFPTRPILRVEGNLIETQLIETLLLNILNFETLIATKASRMRLVAGDKILAEFGLRRAPSLGGYHASRAAVIGGFNSTSNVIAARDYGLQAVGTMAHSFIQSHDDELTAFRSFANARPDHCILLVDTYNTLESGIPNAITVGKEMEAAGHRLKGIRLDSGDLAYLAKRARHMLDQAGLPYVTITASNQLDEYVIKSLEEQNAPIDIFGVGTSLVTGQPDAALDGVYKLSFAGEKPRIKLSESIKKVTLPHRKQVFRVYDQGGALFGADAVTLNDEQKVEVMYHPFEPGKSISLAGLTQTPLLQKVMEHGKIIIPKQSLTELSDFSRRQLALLPPEYKRFQNPHVYKIGLSGTLKKLRDELKSDALT